MTNGHINPANVPDIALKDGHSIPQVGLGVLRIDDEGVVPTTRWNSSSSITWTCT